MLDRLDLPYSVLDASERTYHNGIHQGPNSTTTGTTNMTKFKQRLLAYHEAAHAVALMHYNGPVHSITIAPGAGYNGQVRGCEVGWQPDGLSWSLNTVVTYKVGVIAEAYARGRRNLARAWRGDDLAWCIDQRWNAPGSDLYEVRRHLACIVEQLGEIRGEGPTAGMTWDSTTTTTAVWLVESHATAIEAVANVLLTCPGGTVSGRDARIIAREALGDSYFGTVHRAPRVKSPSDTPLASGTAR